MKLGYSTWGMPTVPMDVALPHLAALGYEGVEITVIPGYTANLVELTASDRRQIAQLLRDHGLALPSLASQTSLLASDPEEHRVNFARLTGAVDLAVEWAQDGLPPCVDTTVGGTPSDWARVFPLLVEPAGRVGRLCRRAERDRRHGTARGQCAQHHPARAPDARRHRRAQSKGQL